MRVSFVSSFYNNSNDVQRFYKELKKQIDELGIDYEIILIDDGSDDTTSIELANLVELDQKVLAFQNIQNYGEQKSYTYAMSHATLEYVFIVESDLDIDISNISKFINHMKENPENDMVYATINKTFFQKISLSSLFFALFNKISNLKLPQNAAWFRIINAKLIQNLDEFKEYEFHLAGTLSLLSKKKDTITVEKNKSKSKYSIFSKYLLAVNTFINFTSKPLEAVLGFGFSFIFFNLIFLTYLVFFKLNFNPPAGWAGIMFGIFSTFTVLLVILGVLSLYVSKIYKEVKRVPVIISKKL